MNTLDIIFAVVVCIGFAIGCYKGIIRQLTLGAGIVIGLLQAILFYGPAGAKLCQLTGWGMVVCNIIGFVSVLLLVMLIFKLIGMLLKWFFNLIFLGFADRILGGLLTGVITTFFFVGAVSLIDTIDENNELFGKTSQENSMLYRPMRKVSVTIIDEVKKEIHEKE